MVKDIFASPHTDKKNALCFDIILLRIHDLQGRVVWYEDRMEAVTRPARKLGFTGSVLPLQTTSLPLTCVVIAARFLHQGSWQGDPLGIGGWGWYVTMGAAYSHAYSTSVGWGQEKWAGILSFKRASTPARCYVVPTPSWQCGQGTPSTSMIWNGMEIGGPPVSGTPHIPPPSKGSPCPGIVLVGFMVPGLDLIPRECLQSARRDGF